MFLDKETFSTVINSAPLVSIDLVVVTQQGHALLGHRLNKPAQGYWFVPGGRILKNETLVTAFQRLTLNELGTQFNIEQAKLLGPYTHLYDDYVFGTEINTHYVAIAYQLVVNEVDLNLPLDEQHNNYKWLAVDELLAADYVHKHSKWYFEKS